jgi:hypothetical protein
MTDKAWDEDDVPWASPEIRQEYEAALGRFILAFNELDNLLTEIIQRTLGRLDRGDLVKACKQQNFALKLLTLDLLKSSREGAAIADVPIPQMKQVAGERNTLAHCRQECPRILFRRTARRAHADGRQGTASVAACLGRI